MEITIVASKMKKEDVARKEAELRKEVEDMLPGEAMNFIARNRGMAVSRVQTGTDEVKLVCHPATPYC